MPWRDDDFDDGGGHIPRRSASDYGYSSDGGRNRNVEKRPSARDLSLNLSFLEREREGNNNGNNNDGTNNFSNNNNNNANIESKGSGLAKVKRRVRVRNSAASVNNSNINNDDHAVYNSNNNNNNLSGKNSGGDDDDFRNLKESWKKTYDVPMTRTRSEASRRRRESRDTDSPGHSRRRRSRDHSSSPRRLHHRNENGRSRRAQNDDRRRRSTMSDEGYEAGIQISRLSEPESDADKKQREEYRRIGKDFPEFTNEQVDAFITQFFKVDTKRTGSLSPDSLVELLTQLGQNVERSTVDDLVHSIDVDGNGTIEFDEFLLLLRKIRSAEAGKEQGFHMLYQKLIAGQKSWMHLFRQVEARRNVDMLIRTKAQMLVQHYAMADNKANILITVCSIVLSFSIQQITNGSASFSLLCFSLFTIVALFFAVGSVLPRYQSKSRVSSSNSKVDNFNLLFFEDFAKIPMDTFMEAMAELLKHDDKLYAELCRDLYLTGVNLSVNKYKWLRRSYITFGYGTVCTVVVFFVTALLNLDAQEMFFND